MPPLNEQALVPILNLMRQIASGMGHRPSTAHLLLAIVRLTPEPPNEVRNILQSFNLTTARIMGVMGELSVIEHPSLLDQALTAGRRACVLSNQMQVQPIHLLIGLLALNQNHAYQLLNRLQVNGVQLQARLAILAGMRVSRRRQAGEPAVNINHPAGPLATRAQRRPAANQLRPLNLGSQSALAIFSKDLTLLASQGKIDPVIGRENEINRAIQVLCRKKKNNVVFIGEAGVGKTAVAEGIAQRLVTDSQLPSQLRGKRILTLNLTDTVAGTMFRGQFESRLQAILRELRQHPEIVVFLDELHTIVGAGSAQGSLDAANILKPALSSGEIHCIGATTTAEYRKHIEKDKALERRFQPIMIEQPTPEETIDMLRGLKPVFEQFHGVTYTPAAIQAAVDLSTKYITDRNLPDKAVDMMDQAGSAQNIAGLRVVDEEHVAEVVREMTGIPVITSAQEKTRLLNLGAELKQVVIGQDEAVTAVAQTLVSLRDPHKPIGSFIFLGPTGVGKTVLARKLALLLFGTEDALLRFDMSEFQEKHTVSRLVGAPPGYVGYEEGGQLTEQVHRKPYSVLLLDEIEKAHPDIFNTLLQVLDEGFLTDGQGRRVFFYNTIIIMTSNIQVARTKRIGFGVDTGALEDAEDALLKKGFRKEFINRVDEIVVFHHLEENSIRQILDLELAAANRLSGEQKVTLLFSQSVKDLLATEGFSEEFGARYLQRTVKQLILEPLGQKILANDFLPGDTVQVNLQDKKITFTKAS